MFRKLISCFLKCKQHHYSNLKNQYFLNCINYRYNIADVLQGDKLWDLIHMFRFYTINNRTTLYSGTGKTLRCNIRNSKINLDPPPKKQQHYSDKPGSHKLYTDKSHMALSGVYYYQYWDTLRVSQDGISGELDWIWKTILSVHLMMATKQYFWQIFFIF